LRTLLTELDHLTHAARTRRVVLLAREQADHPKLAKLMDRLSAASDYHARLVLTAAAASGDVPRITGFLDHSNPRLRAAALHALPLAELPPKEFAAHYVAAPLITRKMLIRKAADAARADLIDAVLALPLSDADAARLLAHASGERAAERLSDLADVIPNLAAFARSHPDLLLDELARRLDSTPAGQTRAWQWADPALPGLARLRGERLLDLLARHHDRLPASLARSFSPLLSAAPSTLATLLRVQPDAAMAQRWSFGPPRLVKGLRRRISALSSDEVAELARAWRHEEAHLTALLAALPPRQRAAVFSHAFAEDDLSSRVWSEGLLQILPRELRQEQARRIAGLADQKSVATQLHWAQWWSVDDAAELIERQLHARDAAERSQAWMALLANAANSGDLGSLEAALARLERLTNEQDPVRCAAAQALQQVNPDLLSGAHIDGLLDFAEAVSQAADTSSATLAALRSTAWRLIAQSAAHRAPFDDLLVMLDTLAGPDGLTDVPADLALPRAAIAEVVAGLLPLLQARAKRHDFRLLFSLWRALGRRAWQQPDLVELVEMALGAPSDHWQRLAAETWLADPSTRAERVGELLARDETFVTLPVVQRALCRSRQDLLDVCYRRTPLKGRFWKKLRFVPLLPGPFDGWLPGQLSDYADALDALIASPKPADRARPIDAVIGGPRPTAYERARAIELLGALPGIGTQRLAPYLATDEVVLVEAALAALAHGDDPGAGLETLLAHRGGDRARVAMYAAGRCVRYRTPSEAAALLGQVLADPAAKITSRKQAARLIGALRLPDALDSLATLDDAQMDLRIAAGRTMRAFLDDDRAWSALEDLAVGGRDAELSLIETVPEQLAVRHRARYAQVLALAASGGDPDLIGSLGVWTPWSQRLSEHLAILVSSPKLLTSRAACTAVAVAAALSSDWTPYQAAITRLAAAASSAEEPSAEPDADLPSWQRLLRLVKALVPTQAAELAYFRDQLLDLARIFDEYPGLAEYSWRLRLEAVDWSAPDAALAELADRVDPLRAAGVAALVTATLRRLASQGVEPQLRQAAEVLGARGDATGGILAVMLTSFAGERSGWTSPWRDQLRVLRAHPVPAVAAWAHQHFTTVG
jgi:hypothetical protein